MKNKFGSALLAFAIAFCLWLYVITYISPDSEAIIYDIPVVLENESALLERNLMITATSSTSVDLKLSGNRTDLNEVNKGNITLRADLSKIYDPGENIAVSYTISFPGTVASNAFVVESKTPSSIRVTVEKRVTKEVPVVIKWTGTRSGDYLYDMENKVLDYTYITVVGPSSVTDQIADAYIEVDLTGQTESLSQSYRYTLRDKDGNPVDAESIKVNVEEVKLELKIQRVKEVDLAVELLYGGGVSKGYVDIEIEPKTIRLSGSEVALDDLGDVLNLGTIDLATITKSTSQAFAIILPENVTNETGITEATVNITFVGLGTKEFVVETIRPLNVPEGLEAELITEKLTVTVRGPSSEIAMLTSADVSVSVDLSNAEEGTATYKATVMFPEDYKKVGAVGTYSVTVTVKQSEE